MSKPELATNLAPEIKFSPALILEIDGTIRRATPANFRDVELMPGIERKMHEYRLQGFLIVGMGNEDSIAHGRKLPIEADHELEVMLGLFAFNPMHIVKQSYMDAEGCIQPYNHRSFLRMPEYGMLPLIERDAFQHGIMIDWNKSIMVGSSKEFQVCATMANIQYIHTKDFLR